MEANESSLRLESLVPAPDTSSRRQLKSSGSGGRRRKSSDGVGHESSASLMSRGSRGGSGNGGSHRRVKNSGSTANILKDQQSSSTLGFSNNNHHPPLAQQEEPPTKTNSKTYANKYMAAQAIFDEEHRSNSKRSHPSRRPSRRGSTDGISTGNIHNTTEKRRGSKSPSGDRHGKYKSIARAGRRHSIDTSNVSKESIEAGLKAHGVGERKIRGVTRASSSKGPDRSLTATAARLKKVFSSDGTTPPRRSSKSPSRDTVVTARRNSKSPARDGVTKLRRNSKSPSRGVSSQGSGGRKRRSSMIDPKTSSVQKTPTAARRPSLQPSHSGSDDSQKQKQPSRHPYDRAYKTSWDPPKRRASLSLESLEDNEMNSSMPSLAALDLSVHSGKRPSDASIMTSSTLGEQSKASGISSKTKTPPPLLKAQPSFSLLVDNAQSHMSSRAIDLGNPIDPDEDDSILDIYNAAASVDTNDPHTDGSQMSQSDESGPRTDGSRKAAGSRMGNSSRVGSGTRRRAQSHDDKANAATRRKRSPTGTSRASSRGTNKRGSSRNARSNSSEGKPRRRASMAARVLREERAVARANSARSFEKKREPKDDESASGPSQASLRRSQTDGTGPRRHKSSDSLQRSQMINGPSRQKSSSSIRSSNSRESQRQIKKNRYEASMSRSLSNLAWNGGDSDEKDLSKLSKIAGTAKSRRKSSTMSVGSNSLGNRSTRRASLKKRQPPRRSMSSDSVSLASYDSNNVDVRKRRSSSVTSDDVPTEKRSSDATTWSLADIDLGKDAAAKADPDESVMTPATVSSSSAEEIYDVVTAQKIGKTKLRRSKSTGSSNEKPSKPSRAGKAGESRSGKGGGRRPSKKTVAQRSAKAVDDDDDDDSFQGTSHHNEFASRDPLGLIKVEPKKPTRSFAQSKKNDALDKESFHMTSDFGDFGTDSFSSAGFDDDED